jgi:CubicO group peptidase (beta-lactamase class C family)
MVMLTLFALALVQAPAGPQQGLPDSTRVALNRVFATWTSTNGPGCAVGVSRNSEPLFQNGYGMANLEHDIPITPATIFHVASVSKQFTAMAVMLLAADGKLSLNDDIRKHLPELPDYGHRITIRHLLTHTSGLRDQWDLLIMARGRFEENRITEADVLEIVARQKALNFVPGSEYLYSNTGYTLAGTIVRRVSGQSLRAFADQRIFQPLGMSSTHFHDDYTMIVPGRAAGYARSAGNWRVSLPNYDTYGATSLFTTVGDLLKWEANFAKPVVGTEPLLREMMASATITSGDTTAYGLGVATESYRGTRLFGHGGADAGYRTWSGRAPEHGLAVTVLCNASTANPTVLARGVIDVLAGARLAGNPPPGSPVISLPAERLARFTGVYAHPVTGAPQVVMLRGDTLFLGRNGPALQPLAENRFRVTGQAVELVFTADGSLVQTWHAWPPRAPVTSKRVAPALVQMTKAELERYAGTWYSEELGASYTVTATDSTLVLKTRGGGNRTVRPAYGDTFVGDYLVRFTRGRGGRIDGMLLSSGRVRGVRFVRSPPGQSP